MHIFRYFFSLRLKCGGGGEESDVPFFYYTELTGA